MRCLVVIKSVKGEAEEGHRRRAEKNRSYRLPFKIGKTPGEKYPKYLRGESGVHASHQSEQSDTERQHFLGSGLYGAGDINIAEH